MHDEVMGWTRSWNAQTLSADCDLDLATWFLYATKNNNHFCQLILKSDHA